jgi:phosphoglycerate dehydrogenase-like enzyme
VIRTSERITEAVAADGGGVAGSDWFEAQRALKTELLYLAERGILLRDPETGLVDFPGEVDGRPVFLCWRLGEDEGRVVPRAARRVLQQEAPLSTVERTRPTVVVMGATVDEPPPNIGTIADHVDLRYAPDRASLEEAIVDAEIVYTWWGERADLVAAWPRARKLEWVAASNVGINALLFPALVESDVVLTNARGAADQPITETVVGFVVALAKGFRPMFDRQRAHVWETHETDRLAGSTVVVVGPGPIGRSIGRALRDGLGMRTAAVGRSARAGDDVFETIRGIDDLHAALAEADYVIDAMPLTPQTGHVFDAAAFGAMKPTARFINVGRGKTVVEPALVDALMSGGIAGAALDVFEEEPLPVTSALWDMENVIVCPHMSGDVMGWDADFADVFYDNVRRWLQGAPLRNVVDKRLGFPTDGATLP